MDWLILLGVVIISVIIVFCLAHVINWVVDKLYE